MSIVNQTQFVSANTIYQAKGEEIFSRPQEGLFQLFTDEQPLQGQALALELFGVSPSVKELVGSRTWGSLREYLATARVKTFTAGELELPKSAVDGDATGALAKRLTDNLAVGPFFWDKVACDLLLSNPNGIDLVPLISDSHPYGPGGTNWDNKTTDALDATSFAAAMKAMKGLKGENGESLGVKPTHLMVGTALEPKALEITGASRPLFAGTSGEATSSILAVTTIENVYRGSVIVVVNPRMSDTDWLLMDLSKAGVRPIAMGVQSPPRAVAVTDPQSEPVVNRSMYRYYMEGAAALAGFVPHVIYGRLGA